MVVAAVAAGAAAGTTETAKQAVIDAYQSVKNLISRRYSSVDVELVERQPQSASRRAVLAEELERAGVGSDEELLTAAQCLLLLVSQNSPQAAETVGVRLRQVSSGELEITTISSAGSGVIADDITVTGTLKISEVNAGPTQPPGPSTARP